jgi:hypothetical protein
LKLTRTALLATLAAVFVVNGANPVLTSKDRTGKWPPQAGSSYSFGGPFEIYYQAVPTSLTDVDSYVGDNRIISYAFFNSTGGALTLTVQTKDGSPLPLPGNGSLAAGTSVLFNIPAGMLVKNGWSIQASGSGVYVSAVWTH